MNSHKTDELIARGIGFGMVLSAAILALFMVMPPAAGWRDVFALLCGSTVWFVSALSERRRAARRINEVKGKG